MLEALETFIARQRVMIVRFRGIIGSRRCVTKFSVKGVHIVIDLTQFLGYLKLYIPRGLTLFEMIMMRSIKLKRNMFCRTQRSTFFSMLLQKYSDST